MNGPAVEQVIVGYDGSPQASAAVHVGALLLPHAHAWITNLWTPPFADEKLRRRLWSGGRRLDEFIQVVEREGEWRASCIADIGVTLARAAGWHAEALLRRVEGGEGFSWRNSPRTWHRTWCWSAPAGWVASEPSSAACPTWSCTTSPKPVLVVPHPLLSTEYAALADGPVVLGWDGSSGAQIALTATERLLPDRKLLLVRVDDDTTLDGSASLPPMPSGRALVPLRVKAGHGTPALAVANSLIACARDHEAALLVVGSRGRSAMQEIVLGSVAMATLHHAHRPVLVVPGTDRR